MIQLLSFTEINASVIQDIIVIILTNYVLIVIQLGLIIMNFKLKLVIIAVELT